MTYEQVVLREIAAGRNTVAAIHDSLPQLMRADIRYTVRKLKWATLVMADAYRSERMSITRKGKIILASPYTVR